MVETAKQNEVLQKITAKDMGFDRITIGGALRPMGDNAELFLYRVFGLVDGLKPVEGKNGDVDFGLKGQFEALRADGVKAVSGVAFLPGGIQAMIQSAYESASETDKRATVTFAVDIYAVKSSNAAGYTFKGKEVGVQGSPTKVDPFADIREAAAQIALPAPVAVSDKDKAAAADAAAARDAKEVKEAMAKVSA
jgi:hypothetical protein